MTSADPLAPTLKDIAAASGLSVAAVSKVLNERKGVSAESRARVLRVIEELGYRGRAGRAAPAGQGGSATLVTLDRYLTSNNFYGEIIRGILEGAAAAGIRIDIDIGSSAGAATADASMFANASPNAVVLVGIDSPDIIDRIAALGCPAVIVNGMDSHMRIPSVSPDFYFGGYAATRHLLDLGHRDIVHVTHVYRKSISLRLEGFRDALADAGIAFDPARHVLDLQDSLAISLDARPRIADWLAKTKRRPTALFCVADIVALAALQAASGLGIRVPEDLSIMGFDGLPIGAHASPPLTTMIIDRYEIGRIAVRLLQERLAGAEGAAQRIATGVQLIVRRSTAAPGRR